VIDLRIVWPRLGIELEARRLKKKRRKMGGTYILRVGCGKGTRTCILRKGIDRTPVINY
jgi:hypothetical protein